MTKKILCLALTTVMLVGLCSCQKVGIKRTEYFGYLSAAQTVYENGLLYIDYGSGGIVKFADFDSLTSVPICPRPNCPHTAKIECSALGISGTIFIYENSLCWLESGLEYSSDGTLTDTVTLYMSDTNGTNRLKIAKLTGCRVDGGAYAYGDKIYLCADSEEYKDGLSTDYAKEYLCSYDFSSGKFTELYEVSEGYYASIEVEGRFQDGLYLSYWDGIEVFGVPAAKSNMVYRFETGEFERLDYSLESVTKDRIIYTDAE